MNFSSYGYGDHVGYLPDSNDVIICPYNTSHVVGVSRMQRHLMNCRRKNPQKAANITICTYNQSHHIPNADLSAHYTICRDYLAHRFQNLIRISARPREELFKEPEEPQRHFRSEQDELRHQLRKLEHQADYFEDATADRDDVSLSGFSIDGIAFEAGRPPKESVVVKKQIDGEIWTVHQGAGYEIPWETNYKPIIHAPLPEIQLPPCDQEEIDNWT